MQMSPEKLHFDFVTFKNHVFTTIYVHMPRLMQYMFILTFKRRVIKLEPPVLAVLLNHFEVN